MIKDKYEFFYKPTTKQEIIGDREVVPTDKYNLVETVRGLSNDQAIILDISEGDESQDLLPERYHSSENFLKHGRKVVIDGTDAMCKSREEKFGRIHASESFAEYAGISWKPPRGTVDERTRIVHLVDCMDAVRIFHYLANNQGTEFVHEAKPSRKGPVEVANYGINIPSRSEEKRENVGVTLMHTPYTRKGSPARVVASLEGKCDCEYNRFNNLVYQDKSTGTKFPLFMDMHIIAAYLAVIDKEQKSLNNFMKKKGKSLMPCAAMVYNPFPLPAQRSLQDYIKLENQAMVKDVARDNEGKVILKKNRTQRTKHRK